MIIISNGFGQFHMARLAEKLSERGDLGRYFTGGYPRPGVLDRFTRLVGRGIRRRHAGRAIHVPLALIRDFWIPELPHQVSQLLGRTKFSRLADWAEVLALRIYACQAGRELARAARGTSGLRIYHYRAGYGGRSISVAKKMGLRVVCDHSIAHPRVLEGLVSGGPTLSTTLSRFWGRVEEDIAAADHIVVNSSFVRATMAVAGVDLSIVSVAYTAVDPAFVKVLDSKDPGRGVLFSHIAFPGTLELRKGIDLAINAASLESSGVPWVLYGEWAQDAQHFRKSLPPNVSHSGKLDREDFAAMLAARPVVVFPSRAEGSARVLAEALVAGCFVITTQAAGSLVRDGIDGRVFELATAEEFAQAVRDYMALSPAEKYSKSEATRAYARQVLSEEAYAEAVRNAYATAMGCGE